jgi:Na+-translocating ferredoxin:NAD+ oxidoreductase RnfE subunit
MVVALLLSAWVVYRSFGVFIPVLTWLRAALAGLLGYWVAAAVPHDSAWMTIIALILGFVSAVVVLVITRELGTDDWQALRRIASRD